MEYSLDGKVWRDLQIPASKSSFDLENLQPFTKYIVRLTATSRYFKSEPSVVQASTTEGGRLLSTQEAIKETEM